MTVQPERITIGPGSDMTVRVTAEVHRRLLTIQYQQKITGRSVSLSEVIGQLLDRAGTA